MCMEILEMFSKIEVILNDFLMNAGVWAPILSCILVFLEGILAFLPLFLFVTVNVLTMGNILGVIFSWIFSTLGGFTTFSTFSLDTLRIFNEGQHMQALLYVGVSLLGGLLAAWLGMALIKFTL